MLKLEDKDLFFENDDEFYEFAVVPALIFKKEGGTTFTDFDFTDSYYDAINENRFFYIKDPKSLIAKRGALSYKTITKPVQNLGEYVC
jgi:hypothetical protein